MGVRSRFVPGFGPKFDGTQLIYLGVVFSFDLPLRGPTDRLTAVTQCMSYHRESSFTSLLVSNRAYRFVTLFEKYLFPAQPRGPLKARVLLADIRSYGKGR
jgi:hypothetical protein